ncbi:uncharacterized protein MONOS_14565 [Monocercomonoides exilis]|uniref:uncharacterized protein n=1 Tax=Monocercomonoides exilis TaxID=2049356 RepID=UPI00355A746A|nr:hypothetical protein MONOS_14565 [Monocercomonoides exilis]|eukprot:MONOS_14565.1-p1 / transcript=MONOS_14565.1 / gene=MONOS_14565 / organism=Monocercomonoides_exilis_PA203 / gene_product=unspecified product / transcript_product=unspecified product / location=Mono_scaffold01025:10366-10946(-) / protein_length=121 / sequence_SO=supercontig / SO=protein_coding / is_pseudo=false
MHQVAAVMKQAIAEDLADEFCRLAERFVHKAEEREFGCVECVEMTWIPEKEQKQEIRGDYEQLQGETGRGAEGERAVLVQYIKKEAGYTARIHPAKSDVSCTAKECYGFAVCTDACGCDE